MFHMTGSGCALVLQKDLEYWAIGKCGEYIFQITTYCEVMFWKIMLCYDGVA